MEYFDFVLITFYYRENVRQLELVLIKLGCKNTHKEKGKVKRVHNHHFQISFMPVPDFYLQEVLKDGKLFNIKAGNFTISNESQQRRSESQIFWDNVPKIASLEF